VVKRKGMQLTEEVLLYRPGQKYHVIPLTHPVLDSTPGQPFGFHVVYSPGSVAHTLSK
jgi:hypothetical protein